jgi:hypothetical protein
MAPKNNAKKLMLIFRRSPNDSAFQACLKPVLGSAVLAEEVEAELPLRAELGQVSGIHWGNIPVRKRFHDTRPIQDPTLPSKM